MIYCPPSVVLRALLAVLLVAGLGSCRIFHPYRLPTPKPSPEFKAQQKAAKSRKKASDKEAGGLFKKKTAASEEAATDVSTPSGGATAAVPTAEAARTLPERSTVRYDKQGLMKKPRLMRRRINKTAKPFRPGQFIRSFFKFGLHEKPNYSPDHRPAPKQPGTAPDGALPDEAMPTPAPDAGPTGKP